MDIQLLLRVLGRFRVLIAGTFALAVLLAFISYVRVDLSHGYPRLSYRQSEGWVAYSQLLVTQPGFAFGSTLVNPAQRDSSGWSGGFQQVQAQAEPRLTTLASLYSRLVLSDGYLRILLKKGPVHGTVSAAPLTAPGTNDSFLPIVNITANSTSEPAALDLARRASMALRTYLRQQQSANAIMPDERVQLRVLLNAGHPELIAPRKKTLPLIAFFTVMIAGIALALVLENMRPRVRKVEPNAVQLPDLSQRSAS
jgi:hypothetical protein